MRVKHKIEITLTKHYHRFSLECVRWRVTNNKHGMGGEFQSQIIRNLSDHLQGDQRWTDKSVF